MAWTQLAYDESTPVSYGATPATWVDPGSAMKGLLTSSKACAEISDSTCNNWVETQMQYDQFGNPVFQWDANQIAANHTGPQYATHTEFDDSQMNNAYQWAFPIRIITPAPDRSGATGSTTGFVTSSTYDTNTGLVLTTTDLNGQTTTMEYADPLLRLTRISPGGGAQTLYEYGDQIGTLFHRSKRQISATEWNQVTTCLNGFGLNWKVQRQDSEGDVLTESTYDNLTRLVKTNNPYRAGEAKKWVETTYDEQNRVKDIISPTISSESAAAKITTEYALAILGSQIGAVSIGTNQSGRKGRSISDAMGRVIRVDEPLGTSGELGAIDNPNQPTYYAYDIADRLRQVTQGSQSRYFMYDALGRLIRVRQPEQDINAALQLTDSVTGNTAWSAAFTYDNNGNVLTSTDAKGVTITYTYDALNRVVSRSYAIPQTTDPKRITAATPSVAFKYDGLRSPTPDEPSPGAIAWAKGKLTEISSSVSTTQYTSFDLQGRTLSSKQITDQQVYRFGYSYNLSGFLTEVTYPSGRVVKNTYDTDDDVTTISSRLPQRAPRFYASNLSYSASGDVTQIQLGNGRWEGFQFNSRNQITQRSLGTSAGATDLWKVNYEYGKLDQNGAVDVSKNDGNVAKQVITVPGISAPFVQSYTYDPLNRLVEAKEQNGSQQTWQQTFQYDRYGNRNGFSQTVSQTQLTLNNVNHPTIDSSTNRFQGDQGYEYDYNGNLIQDAQGRQFHFNAENKQVEVKDQADAPVGSYLYDGSGNRIKKIVPGVSETTVFVYDAGGKLAAEYATQAPTAPQLSYVTHDSIGSPRIITNQDGQVVSRRDFLPFGEELSGVTVNRSTAVGYGVADNVRQRFTGYQRDTETLLDFAEARYYNGQHGRFTAVDPLLASGRSSNPQTFNRYVHAGNNPILRRDPDGQKWYTKTETKLYGGVSKETEVIYWSRNPTGDNVVTQYKHYATLTGGNEVQLRVLNPFENDFATVANPAAADSAMASFQRQAALNFIVGAAEAASVALSFSEALNFTGVNRQSEMYQAGHNVGTIESLLAAALGVGASNYLINKAAGFILKKFGKAGLAAFQAARAAKAGERAEEVHSALSPIAQEMRTTAVLETSGGRVVAAGGRDLTPAQRALLGPGETAAKLPGAHAEITALQQANRNGLTPEAIGVTRAICPECETVIRTSGGTLITPTTAVWPW